MDILPSASLYSLLHTLRHAQQKTLVAVVKGLPPQHERHIPQRVPSHGPLRLPTPKGTKSSQNQGYSHHVLTLDQELVEFQVDMEDIQSTPSIMDPQGLEFL